MSGCGNHVCLKYPGERAKTPACFTGVLLQASG
jgi:hypothetical protein